MRRSSWGDDGLFTDPSQHDSSSTRSSSRGSRPPRPGFCGPEPPSGCRNGTSGTAGTCTGPSLPAPEPPSPPADIPDFTSADLQLLRALAAHSENEQIAAAAGIALASVNPHVKDLVKRAVALNPSHLVGLGHAWGLLGATDG